MGHDRRVLDQALDAAQRFGECEELGAFEEAARVFEVALELDRDHPTEAMRHLPLRQRVLRMRGEAGVVHARDLGMRFEPLRQLKSILAVALHPQGQGLHAAQREVAVEGPQHRADGVLQKGDALGECLAGTRDEQAVDHVRVAADVLGAAVHHAREAMFQRPLEIGRGKGVVGPGRDAVLACDPADG